MGNRSIPAYIKELIFLEAAKRIQEQAEFIAWMKGSKGETGTLRVSHGGIRQCALLNNHGENRDGSNSSNPQRSNPRKDQ